MSSTSNATRNRALVATLAALGALLAAPASPSHAAEVRYQRGVTVGDWGRDAYAAAPTRRTLVRLRRRGVRSVTLFSVAMQRNERSSSLTAGGSTVRTARLARAIRIARSLRLRVVLRPYVDLRNRGWRGDIRPRRPLTWWRAYRGYILRSARLARRTGVSLFVVGSEMKSQSPAAARWRALVADVRDRFPGAVTYEANWDEFESVGWWNALDVIDVSGYFPLSTAPGAPVDLLTAGWADPRERLRAVSERYGRPVLLGEVGFTASAWTGVQPWNVETPGPVDAAAQAAAYQATFRAWEGVPWFRGFQWWFVPVSRRRVGSKPGHQHIPRAAALAVMTRHYTR